MYDGPELKHSNKEEKGDKVKFIHIRYESTYCNTSQGIANNNNNNNNSIPFDSIQWVFINVQT
jgi:hypothetical protein